MVETKTYKLILMASDGYNPALTTAGVIDEDARDEEIAVSVDVTVIRPDLAYPTVRVNVPEEFEGDVLDADGNAVSVSSAIDGATEFEIIGSSGADGSTAALADTTLDFGVSVAGVLSVVQKRDYDVAGAIRNPSLTVASSNEDGDNLGNITVIFNVTPVNEAPSITTTDDMAYVAEDAQNGHDVLTGSLESDVAYQITAEDPEGDSLSYSVLGSDGKAVPFQIDGDGKITVKGNNALDHEAKGSFSVVITASDGSLSDTLPVTIEVGNSNEAPYFVTPQLAVTILENLAAGSNVLTSDTDGDKAAGDRYVAEDADGDVLDVHNQDTDGHGTLRTRPDDGSTHCRHGTGSGL